MPTYVAVTLFVLACVGTYLYFTDPPKAEPASATSGTGPQLASAVPLREWRGMGKMTRKDFVSCSCRRCGNDWQLDSSVSNAIASEQSMGGRLQRAGLSMERTGASLTVGASGRRIAAGNELERANEFLANLYALAACDRCQSVNILLTK